MFCLFSPQFAAHSQILRLLAPSIDWRAGPLRHLPAAAVRVVLHYLYTESLPEGLSLSLAGELPRELRQLPELAPLAELCARYVTNVTLRDGEWMGADGLSSPKNPHHHHETVTGEEWTDDLVGPICRVCQ